MRPNKLSGVSCVRLSLCDRECALARQRNKSIDHSYGNFYFVWPMWVYTIYTRTFQIFSPKNEIKLTEKSIKNWFPFHCFYPIRCVSVSVCVQVYVVCFHVICPRIGIIFENCECASLSLPWPHLLITATTSSSNDQWCVALSLSEL